MTGTEAINYLADQGMSFAEIQEHLQKGIELEELAEAVRSRKARGAPALEDKKPKDERPVLIREELEAYLAQAGITVRQNVVSKEVEIRGVPSDYNPETLTADLHIILHDVLKRGWKCTKDQVADLLGVIAGRNRFNPVQELLASVQWDGQDRLPELFAILGIEEDMLSKILVCRWLDQTVAMSRNQLQGAYGADGMLVLCGPQGIGKTSVVRALGMRPDLYKLGQWLDTRDKDTFRRCTSAWIVELGELETTLRSDLERLKAFVTAERDEYRLPYGRSDQILARRTSFIATCNSARFLIDPTGSRRFWTVPVERIDLERLGKLDVLQLWKQAESDVEREPQCFRLSALEQKRLAGRNAAHEKPLRAQSEIEDIFAQAQADREHYAWCEMTVSEFKREFEVLRGYTVQQIGVALDRVGVETKRGVTGERRRCLPKRLA